MPHQNRNKCTNKNYNIPTTIQSIVMNAISDSTDRYHINNQDLYSFMFNKTFVHLLLYYPSVVLFYCCIILYVTFYEIEKQSLIK